MIAFLTLFLGFVFGPWEVEFSAAPGVARIELFVDGKLISELGPPWIARIDLGPEIVPREFVAVAKDSSGQKVGEVRQWINRPRPGAEAGFALGRDGEGQGWFARLYWRCVTGEKPASLRVSFDGQPLAVTDPARIPLPPHSPGTSHILVADIDFADGLEATAVASFGGGRQDQTLRELTGVPIRLDEDVRLPKSERLQGWFASAGRTLTTAAVEDGPAEVVFVLAGRANSDLGRLSLDDVWPWPWPRARPIGLPKDTRFRFVRPFPRTVEEQKGIVRLYPTSRDFTPADDAFLTVGRRFSMDQSDGNPGLAEAVAVAALSASARDRRRAVVLLLGTGATDSGSIDAARVRRYLARLRVPLFVWKITGGPTEADAEWPVAVPASNVDSLAEAFHGLRTSLAAQRIVWVEGRLNPAAIELTPAAKGVALVP